METLSIARPRKLNGQVLLLGMAILVTVILGFIGPKITGEISYYACVFLCVTLGMMHGCLDYDLETKVDGKKGEGRFALSYAAMYGSVLLLWFIFSPAAILLFLIITAYHFGQTDCEILQISKSPLVIMLYGLGISLWVFSGGISNELIQISLFIKTNFNPTTLQKVSLIIRLLGLTFILAGLLLADTILKGRSVLLLGALLLLTWILPFYNAFIIYFVFWHSVISLGVIKRYLGFTTYQLIMAALPKLVITGALMAAGFIFVISRNLSLFHVFLIAVSCLTLPHGICMHKFFSKSQVSLPL